MSGETVTVKWRNPHTRGSLPNALGVLLIVWCTSACGAEEGLPEGFTLSLADGTTATGPLEELGDQWSVRLGGATPRRAPGTEVVTLRRAGMRRPAYPLGEQVIFANGDRIPGKVLQVTDERLRLHTLLGKNQELVLPLSALSTIWMTAPDDED